MPHAQFDEIKCNILSIVLTVPFSLFVWYFHDDDTCSACFFLSVCRLINIPNSSISIRVNFFMIFAHQLVTFQMNRIARRGDKKDLRHLVFVDWWTLCLACWNVWFVFRRVLTPPEVYLMKNIAKQRPIYCCCFCVRQRRSRPKKNKQILNRKNYLFCKRLWQMVFCEDPCWMSRQNARNNNNSKINSKTANIVRKRQRTRWWWIEVSDEFFVSVDATKRKHFHYPLLRFPFSLFCFVFFFRFVFKRCFLLISFTLRRISSSRKLKVVELNGRDDCHC